MKRLFTTVLLAGCIVSTAATVNASAQPLFSDIGTSGKLYNAVKELAGYSIVNGYEDGTFRPDESVTRAEAVKMIMTFIGKNTGQNSNFDDMQEHWANGYVGAAADTYGFVHGFEDNTFRPDDSVTASQLVTMLLCVTGYEEAANRAGGYPKGYMTLANDKHLFDEMDAVPAGDKSLTRGEAALILQKATEMDFIAAAYVTEDDNSTERMLIECDGGIEKIRTYYSTGEINSSYLTIDDKPADLPPSHQYLDIPDYLLDKILADPDKYTITSGSKEETQDKTKKVSIPDFVPLNIPAPETDDYAIEESRIIMGDNAAGAIFILDDSFNGSWVYNMIDAEFNKENDYSETEIFIDLIDKKLLRISNKDDKYLYIGINPVFDDSAICKRENTLYFFPRHNVLENGVIKNTSGWEDDTALAVRLSGNEMEIFLSDKTGAVKSNIIKNLSRKGLYKGLWTGSGIDPNGGHGRTNLISEKESKIYLTGEYSQAGKTYKVITYSGKQQGYTFSSYDKAIYRVKIGNQDALFTNKQIYRNSVYMGDMLLFEYAQGTEPAYMWISSDGNSAKFIKVKDCDVRPVKYDMRTDSRIEYTESNPCITISKDGDTIMLDDKPFEAAQPEQFSAFMEKVFEAAK